MRIIKTRQNYKTIIRDLLQKIKRMKDYFNQLEKGYILMLRLKDEEIARLKGMISEPVKQGDWIPVKEMLPKANGRYLVTRGLVVAGALWARVYIANYSDLMGIKSEKIWWQGNVGKSDFERLDDVISWMPLPKSYFDRSLLT